jgi:hypothetical protein
MEASLSRHVRSDLNRDAIERVNADEGQIRDLDPFGCGRPDRLERERRSSIYRDTGDIQSRVGKRSGEVLPSTLASLLSYRTYRTMPRRRHSNAKS